MRRAKLSERLRELTQRILTFPEGKHEPSSPIQLLHQLTDEVLTLAVDAVEAVVAEQQPRPSGKAQFRLLAWMVADARGATTLLDKPLAETVGKRLDRQAQKVRGDMAAVSAAAQAARLALGDGADPAAVAAIYAEERTKLESLRSEVYVGFNELETLLPGFEAKELDDFRRAGPEHDVLASALRTAKAEARRPPPQQSLPAIPPELAGHLGPDGVQYLWDHAMEVQAYPQRSQDWHRFLPHLIQTLLAKLTIRQVEDPEESMTTELHLRQELVEALQKLVKKEEQVFTLLDYIKHLEERLGMAPRV